MLWERRQRGATHQNFGIKHINVGHDGHIDGGSLNIKTWIDSQKADVKVCKSFYI